MIDVRIPYLPDDQLAEAYNKIMSSSQEDWVLLLDHDVFLACNPLWYDVCVKVIEELKDKKVGLITCRENNNNEWIIDKHIDYAWHMYKAFGTTPQRIYEASMVAGYFMLVNRQAWEEVKFENIGKGVNKIDHNFSQRLMNVGYELYMIEGLWVYHHRGIRKDQKRWR